jgi:multiple sugar transport system substrate-binding protein
MWRWSRLAAVAGVLGIASGCGGEPAGEAIALWAMGREGATVAALVPEFERRHPGLRVAVQQIPWSAAHEKLLTAFVGDALPDVVQVGSTWVPELAALGALAPLDRHLDASRVVARDDYFASALAPYVLGERTTMALPWYVDTRVLFYRRDALAAAGAATPPGTWDDWLRVMQQITRPPERYALFVPVTDWVLPVVLALQRDATLLRGDAEWGNFQSAPVVAAFAFYRDLFARGLAPVAAGAEVSNVYQEFARGTFAIYPSGPWDLGEFAERLPAAQASAWATAPMPAPVAGTVGRSIVGGSGLALVASSPRQDAAWTFLEYLAEPAQQLALYRLTGDLPARRSAWELGKLREDPRVATFWTQLADAVSVPEIPEWERIAAAIGRTGEAVARGTVAVAPALAALDREVDAILAKRRSLAAEDRARRLRDGDATRGTE